MGTHVKIVYEQFRVCSCSFQYKRLYTTNMPSSESYRLLADANAADY